MLPTVGRLLRACRGPCINPFLEFGGKAFISSAMPPHLEPGKASTLADEARLPPHANYTESPTTFYAQQALECADINPGIQKAIIHPDGELTVALPVPNAQGEIELFNAHLVMHNNARGPFLGGLMYHPDVTLDALRSLAALNTWKFALFDLPLGGAKMGVPCDPRGMEIRMQEKLTRKLTSAMGPCLGPTLCIPSADIGTDERHMAFIFDQFAKQKGFSPGVVTGKPLSLHGSYGRDSAGGRGACIAARMFLKAYLKKPLPGTTVTIQGFGKIGAWTAQLLQEAGAKVIGVSSAETAVYNENGLDIKALREHVSQGRYLAEFPEGTAIAGTVNADNVHRLQSRMVLEASNGGITVEANKVLADKGVPVCPDLFSAGGAGIVSFFEWTQNLQQMRWDEDEILRMQERTMEQAFESMRRYHDQGGLSWRTSAYMVALQRLAAADAQRGHD
ncbi:glutamate dehydrogenase [Dunaliella salina]|uniref:Glutamate dehydrogenase n=1 Tax=Dunaliella salina TaxID=3046 RepID=A0ABQ7G247_DUNSA|nr:glutamate dehydrogenase [Dunaliella salina]|eukprot:KAF5828671.1 glutamate dehydrogenase [Dunaliella salina]